MQLFQTFAHGFFKCYKDSKRIFIFLLAVFRYFCAKTVKHDMYLDNFPAFFSSIYHELSGYVSYISIVCHTSART